MDKTGVREPRPYRPLPGLEKASYVCLRLPTGGGKTLLAAHTVKIAADAYLERDFPIVLWLVSTNTIRAQTLETLRKPGHPNHEALRAAFDGRVRTFEIADFDQITPADLKSSACVIVGTIQTLRVSGTEGRKVYAHNENLEPHFTTTPASTEGLERIEGGDDRARSSSRSAVNGAAIFLKSVARKFPGQAGWRSALGVIGASVFWRAAATLQGRRNGSGRDVRLEADVFGQKIAHSIDLEVVVEHASDFPA